MLIEKRGAVLEAPLQGIDQQCHPGSGHTRWPAVLQQLQQLPGIARQGGELLQQLQARLQGCLILAGLHRLVAQMAQFVQPLFSRRQALAQLGHQMVEQLAGERVGRNPDAVLGQLGQVALGVVGQTAELADSKAEQQGEVVVAPLIRLVVGNQDQRLVEAVIQPQHQRLQQLIFVGLQVDGALEVLPLLLQGADPVAGGGVPQHRQTGIEHEAVDGEPDALLAEVAQGQAVGLLQHLLLILQHQPEQHRQLMPARLMGADLQQLSHGLPRRQPVMLMQLAGELQLQPGGHRDAGLMALQVGLGALQFAEPQHGVEEPGPWPARLILVGTEGIVLGGSDPLG